MWYTAIIVDDIATVSEPLSAILSQARIWFILTWYIAKYGEWGKLTVASVGHLKAVSAPGGSAPGEGLCLWTLLGLHLIPHYRLTLCVCVQCTPHILWPSDAPDWQWGMKFALLARQNPLWFSWGLCVGVGMGAMPEQHSVANQRIKLHSNNAQWLLCNSEID